MSTGEIEKASAVLRGIEARDADLATKYVNPKEYIQHNPRMADGVAGLKEFISQLPSKNHHSEVVRAFQDGPYVFAHEEGLILGQSVFFDIFRFEDGLIVEQWVFSAPGASPNQSGHTQTDGPLRQNSLRMERRTSRLSGNTTRPFTSAAITVKSHSTSPGIIASATSLASAMESRHSRVTWKNSLNTEASMRSSSYWDRETSFL